MKKHWAVVLPLLALGCEGPQDADNDGIVDGVREPDSVSVVAPANPKGTVSGQVLTTRMEPIAEASVQLTIGSATAEAPLTAKTDAAGNFMFKNVPAGSQVLVTLGKDGYATLRASALVPSSAGSVPINNGNASLGAITLAETKSTVRFTLVTPSGRPAAGAQAYLEAVPAGTIASNGTTATAVSTVVATAQADAQGVVSFTRVPAPAELARLGAYGSEAGGYRLWVDPVDLEADGVLDAGGYARKIDASTLLVSGGSQLIQLPAPRNTADSPDGGSGFALVATSLSSFHYASTADAAQKERARDPLRNMLRPGESLFVAFSQPVQKDSLLATVTDEAGREGAPMPVTPNATWDAFSLAVPSQLNLREGQEYNVLLRATSAHDGTTLAWKGYFVSGDARSPRSTALPGFVTVAFKDGSSPSAVSNGVLDPGECVLVTFNQVIVAPEGPGSVAVEAFLNAELGSPSSTDQGEYNAVNGFPLARAAPPMSLGNCFAEKTNYPIDTASFTYTPRYYFLLTAATGVTVPAGTSVRLAFGRQQSGGSVAYETAWATPLTQDFEVPLSTL